ncbi:hypothetical protein PENTCL1PPCAC_26353, partial [Pristionchus entomophagus]
MILPSSSRASAVALSHLIPGINSIPSAQIMGMAMDAIRGDSTLPYDRFHAFQLGMFYSSSFMAASALCGFALIFFFPGDCEKAEEQG